MPNVTPPAGVYNEGQILELTANPADGWAFTGWTGDVISTTNSVSLLMDGDKQVTAVFSDRSHSI